jgi:phage terminase Nu1 subunit (DNA packaging protein)
MTTRKRGRPRKDEAPPKKADGPALDIETQVSTKMLQAWTGWSAPKCISYFGTAKTVGDVVKRLMTELEEIKELASSTIEDADLRLKNAKADIAEIERDAQKGLLVPVVERNEAEVARVGLMRSRLLALPDQLRVSVGLTAAHAEGLERGVRHALEALADEVEAMDQEVPDAP